MRALSGDQRGVSEIECKRSERVLVGAVVVHGPDFFGAIARADEGDLRGGNAGKSAGKALR